MSEEVYYCPDCGTVDKNASPGRKIEACTKCGGFAQRLNEPPKTDKWVLVDRFAESFKGQEKIIVFLLLWGMFMWFAGLITGILLPG